MGLMVDAGKCGLRRREVMDMDLKKDQKEAMDRGHYGREGSLGPNDEKEKNEKG